MGTKKIHTSSKPYPFTCKILAIYISQGANKVLTPKTVFRRLSTAGGVNYGAVRSAIQRLYSKGLLSRSNRGGYYLPDKKAAQSFINEKMYFLGRLPRWPPKVAADGWWDAGRWLDLAGAVVEHGRIPEFRVDSYDCKLIRAYLLKFTKVSRRDRAGQLSFTSVPSFGLSISGKGSVKLFLHSLEYVDDISGFLSECGLSDVRKRLFFDRLYSRSGDAKVSVEMNVLADKKDLPESFVVETQVGGEVIRSRINYSGGNAEFETSGGLAPVHNFLNHLAGMQHGSASEFLQTKYLSSIDDKFSLMASALENLAKELRDSNGVRKSENVIKSVDKGPVGEMYQ